MIRNTSSQTFVTGGSLKENENTKEIYINAVFYPKYFF